MTVHHGPHLLPIVDFGKEKKEIKLRPIADLHYGNGQQNYREVKKVIKEIADDPDMYWIGLGDYVEFNGKRQSHGGVFHQTLNPEQQMEKFVEDFGPIAHKCLALIDGNHDARLSKDWDISPTKWCAKAMGIPDHLYVPDGALTRISLGTISKNGGRRQRSGTTPCRYMIYSTHGSAGSSTTSGKINALQKTGDGIVADVILGGHTHSEIVFRDRIYCPTFHNKEQSAYRDRLYVNSSSFLEYGGYAVTARYRPQPTGTPTIIFSGECEKVSVIL